MKLSHEVRFPLGRQYEMHSFNIEVDDAEFPELEGLTVVDKARRMQGFLLQMGLVFQVGSGYITPESSEFKESWRLASELKGSTPTAHGTVRRPDAQVKTRGAA